MTTISIESVTKRFGEVRAVDEVSLQIDEGELFFLLGPSGCGKTTLLRLLAGFYQPDGGRILFDEQDVTAVPPQKRGAGMVFQNYALWPHMSVAENLSFGLEMRRVPKAERRERIERALDMTQMLEYADRSPNQLSGGQQQRVALARALVIEPKVALLDEPLSNLDAQLRLEMREHIKRLHERLGLTMIYVTHDQSEALSMADRVAVLREGRVRQLGGPRELYHQPANTFVARFIGETNLVEGRVEAMGNQTTVKTAFGELAAEVCPESLRAGDTVTCSIRPERLDVLEDGQERPNVFEGEVMRIVYLGNHEQYFLRLPDGTELKAIEHDTERPKAAVGQPARFGCLPRHVVLLPTEE